MAGQIWVTNSLGGYMYSDKLSKVLRFSLQPTVKYRQFCDVKDAAGQGKGKGDTYHWNVYSDVATAGTTLTETSTMPVTNFTITQGTLTINEYGNSVPYSGKLDDLSQHPVTEIIQKVLKNDAKKAFDTAAFNQRDHAVHQRHGDRHQQHRVEQGPFQGHLRHDEGAEHSALRERGLPLHRASSHLPHLQERPGGAAQLRGCRLPDDPERRNRPLRGYPLRRADQPGLGGLDQRQVRQGLLLRCRYRGGSHRHAGRDARQDSGRLRPGAWRGLVLSWGLRDSPLCCGKCADSCLGFCCLISSLGMFNGMPSMWYDAGSSSTESQHAVPMQVVWRDKRRSRNAASECQAPIQR